MRVVMPQTEPLLPGKARTVAILSTAAAIGRAGVSVEILIPDTRERFDTFLRDQLGIDHPPNLAFTAVTGWHKAKGSLVNWNIVARWSVSRSLRRRLPTLNDAVIHVRNEKLLERLLQGDATHSLPLVYEAHIHPVDYDRELGRPDRRVQRTDRRLRRILNGVAGLVAISSGLRDRLRLAPGFTGPAIVAPSGVELRRFPLSWHGHAAGRSPGPPRAVYVGRLGSWKGIELLIRALPFVPDLELDLVGEGEQKDRAELVNLTSHLGVPGRVRIRGSLAHRDVAAVLADSDVAVHALPGDRSVAARDTSPLKLVEYLAVGVPVVASNVASVREIVTDGKTGILVPAGDAKALATALATVIRNRPLSCQLSTAGRAVAEQRSWDARARKLIPFFEDVLRHHHSGTRT